MDEATAQASVGDEQLRDILTRVRSIALVGASPKPERPSHRVMGFLLRQGYRVVPVNPGLAGTRILGQTVAADLASVEVPVDMVDVFRASAYLEGVVEEALALPSPPWVIWAQLGVCDAAAADRARASGVTMVMDRCPAIDIPRLGIAPVGSGASTASRPADS